MTPGGALDDVWSIGPFCHCFCNVTNHNLVWGISQSWYFPGLSILATHLDLFLIWVHTGLVGCILVSHENIFHTRKQYHLTFQEFIQIGLPCTAWKVSQYGVFSGLYFPAFGLNTERFSLSLRIQSECGKIRTRKKSVFGHFIRSAAVILPVWMLGISSCAITLP